MHKYKMENAWVVFRMTETVWGDSDPEAEYDPAV